MRDAVVILSGSPAGAHLGSLLRRAFRVVDSPEIVKDTYPACLVAILLDAEPPVDWPGFRFLALRKEQRRFTIVGLNRGSDWTPGQRARFLLSGASRLLEFDYRSPQRLLDSLEKAVETWSEDQEEIAGLCERMNSAGFVGASSGSQELFRLVARIANLHSLPALITGETGTGKEVLARTIHRLDPKRSAHRFVAVNCAALSPALVESELFGFRRGSFTGAERDRSGLFRSAEGGVIFLDEIGELDLSLQAKLLRVIQAESVTPLGEDREFPVNVRVITATNRCLEDMVRKREFREDLFYRLNVVRLRIPPLRERPEDIAPLIHHFLERHREISVHPVVGISRDFEEAIRLSRLPGNARQLETIIKVALLRKSNPGLLELADCPEDLWAELLEEKSLSALRPDGSGLTTAIERTLRLNGWRLDRSMEECERIMVKSALSETGGNQTATARLLGITPRSVYNKLRRYRLTA